MIRETKEDHPAHQAFGDELPGGFGLPGVPGS